MTRIVIFAKAPQSGSVKTRLIPALGAEGAAALARRLLAHTLQQALVADVGKVELCMSPAPTDPAWQGIAVDSAVQQTAQGDGDLGARMARVVQRTTQNPESTNKSVLLIGGDCPALTSVFLIQAAQQLQLHDAVMLPAYDGGYVLLGLKAPCHELFDHMPWSTSTVGLKTLQRMAALHMCVWQGPTLHDIDEPADLQHMQDFFSSMSI